MSKDKFFPPYIFKDITDVIFPSSMLNLSTDPIIPSIRNLSGQQILTIPPVFALLSWDEVQYHFKKKILTTSRDSVNNSVSSPRQPFCWALKGDLQLC